MNQESRNPGKGLFLVLWPRNLPEVCGAQRKKAGTWGPLNFRSKWESSAVILVESDGERLGQFDLKLNACTRRAFDAPRGYT